MRISVLGAGAWGTALASHAAQSHDVVLWGRDATLVAQMAAGHVNEAYLPAFTSLVDGASSSVRAVQLYLKDGAECDTVVERLAAAAQRGVRVQVLLDDDVDGNAQQVSALRARGIEAKLDSAAHRTHAKMLVTDGERAMVGSTNWSVSSMRYNNEANVLVEEPDPKSEGHVRGRT
ncbi:MAG: phospholipase D-like domain-containing protein, partial [Ralstonia sp.]